MKDLNLGVAQ